MATAHVVRTGLVVGLVFLTSSPARAQELLPLVPQETLEKLQVTDEQARQIQQLDRRFKQDCFQALLFSGLRVMAIAERAKKEDDTGEPAPTLAIAHEITGTLLNLQRSRADYRRKAIALLSEEQQTRYQKVKNGQPLHADSPILAESIEKKLDLDADQVRQLEALRRETEKKLRAILKPEQQKQLDQWILR
ncbi:MAG: hypothetical protein AB7K24_04775 [Gemmataceae bacterium]